VRHIRKSVYKPTFYLSIFTNQAINILGENFASAAEPFMK
jgi:hypothetical protein